MIAIALLVSLYSACVECDVDYWPVCNGFTSGACQVEEYFVQQKAEETDK